MSSKITLHASAVASGSRGVLITGASGTGKSSLALQLMAFGADLVADDRVELTPQDTTGLLMMAPDALSGIIEARGIGLLAAKPVEAYAVLHVDLDHAETDRLPLKRSKVIGGVAIPSLHRVESPAFPAMVLAYLEGGRVA